MTIIIGHTTISLPGLDWLWLVLLYMGSDFMYHMLTSMGKAALKTRRQLKKGDEVIVEELQK
jgi:nucleoside recognition membrane protein YjiH